MVSLTYTDAAESLDGDEGLACYGQEFEKLAKIKEKGTEEQRKILRNLILYKICFYKENCPDVNSRATLFISDPIKL